jgi:hypothetical protein
MLTDPNTMPGRLDRVSRTAAGRSVGSTGALAGSAGRSAVEEGPALSSVQATQRTRAAATAQERAVKLGEVGR